MDNEIQRSFSGFVKMVIGATGLVAMGAIVAGGSLLKGFREGAKTAKDAERKPDEKRLTIRNLPRFLQTPKQSKMFPLRTHLMAAKKPDTVITSYHQSNYIFKTNYSKNMEVI
ncbi:MAG: hypothetical protein ACI4PH_10325 [Faecousia sp.]